MAVRPCDILRLRCSRNTVRNALLAMSKPNLYALIVAVVLCASAVGIGLWMAKQLKIENCLASGRHNCIELE